MSRIVVIDETIVREINHGNAHLAGVLNSMRGSGTEFWISYEVVQKHLTSQADRRLLADLGVRDDYMSVIARRGSHNLKWDNTVNDLEIDFRRSPTANLALEKKAEIMTMDKGFAKDWGRTGGKETLSIKFLQPVQGGKADYGRARQLLKLPKLNVDFKGNVNPKPKTFSPKPAPRIVIKGSDGKETRWVPKTTGYEKARTGSPISAPPEVGPDAKGNARMIRYNLTLQGINKVLHWINDEYQKGRFEERWAKLKPTVDDKLTKDPSLGALVYVYYSSRTGSADSVITPINIFQDIAVAYGYTRNDAIVNFGKTPRLGQAGGGQQTSSEALWFEPKTPLDPNKLEMPFQKAGLARFVPGKERLVNVVFRATFGFDEAMRSSTGLKVPAGADILFYYLWPPNPVQYFNHGWTSRRIETALEHPAEVVDQELSLATVPVVELDSWANPGDATAAMIFPANTDTAALFKSAKKTRDNENKLMHYPMELIRWVKPKNMRVIKEFGATPMTTGEEVSMHVR